MDDDIDAIIAAAKKMRFQGNGRRPFLNPLSALPSSKRNLKTFIKERVELLYAAYVSLATFVPDEEWESLWDIDEGLARRQKATIRKVLRDMKRNEKEIRTFLSTIELSTTGGSDALDS